jgi:hypothetical protein
MKDQVRSMPPIAHSHYNIRFKPTVIPLFFLGRLKMNCLCINTHFQKATVKKISLGRQSPGRRRVVIQYQYFHGIQI